MVCYKENRHFKSKYQRRKKLTANSGIIVSSELRSKLCPRDRIKPGVLQYFDFSEEAFACLKSFFSQKTEGEPRVCRIDELTKYGSVSHLYDRLYPNAPCVLRCGDEFVLAYYKAQFDAFRHVAKPVNREQSVPGNIRPVNIEQAFAHAFMKCPDIRGIFMNGDAGSGKTLLGLNFGIRGMDEEDLRIFRPTEELGESLGFRKGYMRDKFGPFSLVITDLFKLVGMKPKDFRVEITEEFLYSTDIFSQSGNGFAVEPSKNGNGYKSKAGNGRNGKNDSQGDAISPEEDNRRRIIIDTINFVRGRTFDGEFILVDEAQDITFLDLKTLLTRGSNSTKYVIVGDTSLFQNRNQFSGFETMMKALVGDPLTACINLPVCERSDFASLVVEQTRDLDFKGLQDEAKKKAKKNGKKK